MTPVSTTPRTPAERCVALAALLLVLVGTTVLATQVSAVTLLIVGVPGLLAYGFWYGVYLRKPAAPAVLLPTFLLTIAGFYLHLLEEYAGHYPLAISRLFGFAWTDQAFFNTVAVLTAGLALAALGLLYRKPLAGFVALLFIATRFAELVLFVFPWVAPRVQPLVAGKVSAVIGSTLLADLLSYYYPVTGRYYFPGMYTFLLPVVPAAIAVYRLVRASTGRTPPPGRPD